MGDVSSIMTADPTGSELVNFAHQTAQQLVRENLTRAQIRNIFTEVRKIEALWENNPDLAIRRLNMLKPKLDYATSRSEPVKRLRDVLSQAIDTVSNAQDADERNKRFDRFMNLFEAILAYHRSEGGRN
jgi:CRISPR-associated protein Csm2